MTTAETLSYAETILSLVAVGADEALLVHGGDDDAEDEEEEEKDEVNEVKKTIKVRDK